MTILATSTDVALTTLRSRLAAIQKARALLGGGSPLAVFVDDIAGHYQTAISDLEGGMQPSGLIPGTVAAAAIARDSDAFGCFIGLLDVAQALGVQVEILHGRGG